MPLAWSELRGIWLFCKVFGLEFAHFFPLKQLLLTFNFAIISACRMQSRVEQSSITLSSFVSLIWKRVAQPFVLFLNPDIVCRVSSLWVCFVVIHGLFWFVRFWPECQPSHAVPFTVRLVARRCAMLVCSNIAPFHLDFLVKVSVWLFCSKVTVLSFVTSK